MPLASYSADLLGRRVGTSIGIVVVFVGVILQCRFYSIVKIFAKLT